MLKTQRRHIIHAYRWKCAYWCCFPFVQRSAPDPSVTSHWLPCPHNPPYGHSSQCQSNADSGPWSVMVMSLCVCVLIHVYFGVSVFVSTHVSVCIHACVFLFWGAWWCFVFCFPSSQKEGVWDMKVCRCSDRERRDRASRQRGVGRSQEELSSSNRQRAKRMTVPSSSLSVNMIIFEPSLRSKTCHTTCKMVTKGSQTETHRAAW